MKEPNDNSSETYKIIYATYMREMWLAESGKKSQIKPKIKLNIKRIVKQ